MTSYLKLAFKVLTRRTFFTFISLFGIALTLVVLLVAAAMLDDYFMPHAPQSRFDRVLIVDRLNMLGPIGRSTSNPGYGFIRDHVLTLPEVERVSATATVTTTPVYHGGDRTDVRLRRTDANYWKILDFTFSDGRPFSQDEYDRGARVAVITTRLGERLFEGGPVLGRSFEMQGLRFTVIGVVPPVSISRSTAFAEIWVPITSINNDWRSQMFMGDFQGLVLARSADDFPRLKKEFQSRVSRIQLPDPKTFNELRIFLDTPFESTAREIVTGPSGGLYRGDPAALFRMILGALALLFMALPSLNLVTLNLSRILERSSEIGVRKAFGAARRSLVGQFVLENVVLTLIGAIAALAVSVFVLAWINDAGLIPDARLTLNWRVFAYGVVMAVVFGMLSGVYPAWRMSRFDPVTALRGGAQ